jgi:hypothetical protein
MRIRRGVNQCKIMNLWAQAIAQKAGTSRPSTPTPAAPTSPVGAMCKTTSAPIRYGVCQDVTSCLDIKGTPTRGLCSGQCAFTSLLLALSPAPHACFGSVCVCSAVCIYRSRRLQHPGMACPLLATEVKVLN